MKLGVISDSHDNMPLIKRAVDVLKGEGITSLVHAGDYVAPFSLKPILNAGWEFFGVFGNNDGERLLLDKVSGGRISDGPRIEVISGRRLLIAHYLPMAESVARSGDFDLIISGHTHLASIREHHNSLIINPGELGGWLYGKATLAVIDLSCMDAKILDL